MYTYCHTIDVCLGLRAWNGIKLSSSNESSVLRSFLFRPENQPGLGNMARIGSITTVCNLHLFRTCSVLVFSCSPSRWTFRIPSCNVISNCLSICQSRGSVLSGWTDIWMSLTHCSFRSWLCSSCGCTTEVRWTYWRTDLMVFRCMCIGYTNGNGISSWQISHFLFLLDRSLIFLYLIHLELATKWA
jgi:hypothetical protein